LKAIILAAGEGKRLRPLTNLKPKCMVELFGKSLLMHNIELLRSCGVTDISVVTGYMSESISIPNVSCFHNPNFANTNMIETLFCAKEKLVNSVIISYADIIYEKSVLKSIINSNDDMSIIFDKQWERYWKLRFDNPLDDAESLIVDDENFVTNIGQKVKDILKIQGQYIGLMKFQNLGIKHLIDFYETSKKISVGGINPLNTTLPFEKSYMTDLLQGLIDNGFKIRGIPIKNGWLEIDSITDYEIYKKMSENNQLSSYFSLENMINKK